MIYIFICFLYIQIIKSNHLVFPFKKLTIESLNETKTISDFIQFNIYTEIPMGSPKKSVAHFIVANDGLFYFSRLLIHYTGKSEYDKIQKNIENSYNIFYKSDESSSFNILHEYYGIYSDIFYLYDLNNNEKIANLSFNMNIVNKDSKVCGSINLHYKEAQYEDYEKYFFKELKEKGLIKEYYMTFLYDEYKLDFNYFNGNYNNTLGYLILGDSPHEFNPLKYNSDDEIKINADFLLYININEIKFKFNETNYSEKNFRMNFDYNSGFIRGSIAFKNETDKLFFDELISQNLCKIDIVNENVAISENIIYSCENNKIMQEKIKNFPTIYFLLREYNLVFSFNYKELFKLHNNRLYFLIIYKKNVIESWSMGELFIRKYITSFNYDSKIISFYKQQVDEINKKSALNDSEEYSDEIYDKPEKKEQFPILIITIISILSVITIILVIVLILVVREWKKLRIAKTNELNDDYEYIPKIIN